MLSWWLPENVSTYGEEIDWLFSLIYYITGITFILVTAAFLAFIVIYRDRPGRQARYTHGSAPLEIVWTVVPALILVVLTFLSVPAWSEIKMASPRPISCVQVTGKQFNWQVTYPGADGKFGTADDKMMLDEMHVPVGKPIRVNLRSVGRHPQPLRAPVPLQAGRRARPGDRSWFEVTKPGKYEMPCAELCGFGHSGMRGWVYAHTAEDYAKWAAENLRAGAPAATAAKDEPRPGPTPVARSEGKGKR